MLASMFSGRFNIAKDSEHRYFIDRDGTYFPYILDFLRDDTTLPPPSLALRVSAKKPYIIFTIHIISGLTALIIGKAT